MSPSSRVPDEEARPRRQEVLIFEVTQRCNLDCLHCYNAWKNRQPYPAGELDTGETLSMLDRVIEETGAREVTLTGGEPLLRADIVEIVEHLNRSGVGVDMITNGFLLDEDLVARLSPGKIGVFELPLLSSEARIHDRMSASDGAFDRVTLAIADLKLAGQHVISVFVATRLNIPTFRDTVELAFALGVDGIMFNRFNPGGRGFDNLELLQPTVQELEGCLDVAQEFTAQYELPISCSIAMPPCLFDHEKWPGLSFGFCAAGTDSAYYTLDPVGNLRPCNHSMVILGNVRQRRFWDLVDSQPMAEFMEARPRFCEDCRVVHECLGGCKAAAEVCHGDLRSCDPFLNAFRHQVKKR